MFILPTMQSSQCFAHSYDAHFRDAMWAASPSPAALQTLTWRNGVLFKTPKRGSKRGQNEKLKTRVSKREF